MEGRLSAKRMKVKAKIKIQENGRFRRNKRKH
jgi:hypothetical protein